MVHPLINSITLHVPAKKLGENDLNTNDDLYFNSRKAERNNVTYKYDRKKYEFKTNKIGIVYKNVIKSL